MTEVIQAAAELQALPVARLAILFHWRTLQDREKDLSRTMVLVDGEVDPTGIIGHHTLLI